jgi:hypothetical protein
MLLRTRFLSLSLSAGLALAACVALSAFVMQRLHHDTQSIAQESVAPIVVLARIDNALLSTRLQALAGFLHDPAGEASKLHDHAVDLHVQAIDKARSRIEEDLRARSLPPGAATQALAGALGDYIFRVVEPTQAALRAGRWQEVARLVTLSNGRYVDLIEVSVNGDITTAQLEPSTRR